jgi:hypothetical protein
VVGQAPWLAIGGRVPRGDAALMAVGHWAPADSNRMKFSKTDWNSHFNVPQLPNESDLATSAIDKLVEGCEDLKSVNTSLSWFSLDHNLQSSKVEHTKLKFQFQ